MNCAQTKKQLRNGFPALPEVRAQMEAHAQQCHACRTEIAIEWLTISLVQSFATHGPDPISYGEHHLVYRTMERIREIKEQRANSWAAAVINLRSWVFGFGAAALLLLALSAWEVLTSPTWNTQEDTAFDLTQAPSTPPLSDEELDYVHR